MTEGSARVRHSLVLVMAAGAGVTALDALVTLSSMSSSLAHWIRVLSLAEHAGALAFGLLACVATVRSLGMCFGAACALWLAMLAISGRRDGSLALPSSAFVGALDVCIWTILVRELRSLPLNLRNPVFLLNGLLAALAHLLAYGLFSARSLVGAPMAGQVVGVGLASFVVLVCVPRGAPEIAESSAVARPWTAIVTLLVLALPAKVGAAVASLAQLPARVRSDGHVVMSAAGSPWLEHSAALLGQCGVLAAAAWLALAPRRIETPTLAGWCSLVGAALVPCSMIADGTFSLLGSLGSGIVSAASPLLVLTAALLVPRRFVPLVLAGWFSSNFVVSMLTSWIGRLVTADRGVQVLLVVAASLLMLGGAAGLLLIGNGGGSDGAEKGHGR